jgi:hypothetical protein
MLCRGPCSSTGSVRRRRTLAMAYGVLPQQIRRRPGPSPATARVLGLAPGAHGSNRALEAVWPASLKQIRPGRPRSKSGLPVPGRLADNLPRREALQVVVT